MTNTTWSPILAQHMNQYDRRRANKTEAEMTPEELFSYNVPFAIAEANKYAGAKLDGADLIQESLRGLHEASLRFDPERDNKFITYAVWWCRTYIQGYIAEFSTDVRIPRNAWLVAEQTRRGVKASTSLIRHNGDTVKQVEAMRGGFLSLDAEIEGMDGATIGDAVAGDHGRQGEDVDDMVLSRDVEEFLSTLSDRHALVVRGFYGLDGEEPRTLEGMRDEFGVSRERVRQLREEALDEVRENRGGRYQKMWDHADERLESGARVVGSAKKWRARRAKR